MANENTNSTKKTRKTPTAPKAPTLGLDAAEKKVTMGKVKFSPDEAREYAKTLNVLADAAGQLAAPQA